MQLSVVIPVYEDRAELAKRWAEQAVLQQFDELVVVDASERDPVQAEDLPARGRLVRAPLANRGAQLNLGAAAATGEALLFLHADTVLPAGALEAIKKALQDPAVVGGGFVRHFDSPSRFLRWTCRLAACRSRRWGWFLGDQAIFVRRAPFEAMGGFRVLRAFEDYDLCRRLKRRGELRCLEPVVRSSARRFVKDGAVRRSFKDLALTLAYVLWGCKPFEVMRNAEIKEKLPPQNQW